MHIRDSSPPLPQHVLQGTWLRGGGYSASQQLSSAASSHMLIRKINRSYLIRLII